MRRRSAAARVAATAVGLLLLSACTDPTGLSERDDVRRGYDKTGSAVQKAQDWVERAKGKVQPEVDDVVTPYIPERFRDQPGFASAAVETYLEKTQAARFEGLGEVGKATCPASPELKRTMTVRCTLSVAGTPVPFDVQVTGVATDAPKVSAAPVGVIIPGAKLATLIGAKGGTVICGKGGLLVGDVGDRVDCTLSQGPQSAGFTVTVIDASGRVAIS